MAEILDVVCVIDESGNEAIYVDGELNAEHKDIYIINLVAAIGDEQQPFRLRQIEVDDFEGDWPKMLAELKLE